MKLSTNCQVELVRYIAHLHKEELKKELKNLHLCSNKEEKRWRLKVASKFLCNRFDKQISVFLLRGIEVAVNDFQKDFPDLLRDMTLQEHPLEEEVERALHG